MITIIIKSELMLPYAVEDYKGDGGRSTEVGHQRQISNHLRRLSLRAMGECVRKVRQ